MVDIGGVGFDGGGDDAEPDSEFDMLLMSLSNTCMCCIDDWQGIFLSFENYR